MHRPLCTVQVHQCTTSLRYVHRTVQEGLGETSAMEARYVAINEERPVTADCSCYALVTGHCVQTANLTAMNPNVGRARGSMVITPVGLTFDQYGIYYAQIIITLQINSRSPSVSPNDLLRSPIKSD